MELRYDRFVIRCVHRAQSVCGYSFLLLTRIAQSHGCADGKPTHVASSDLLLCTTADEIVVEGQHPVLTVRVSFSLQHSYHGSSADASLVLVLPSRLMSDVSAKFVWVVWPT